MGSAQGKSAVGSRPAATQLLRTGLRGDMLGARSDAICPVSVCGLRERNEGEGDRELGGKLCRFMKGEPDKTR